MQSNTAAAKDPVDKICRLVPVFARDVGQTWKSGQRQERFALADQVSASY
jgi:hypothetical protein